MSGLTITHPPSGYAFPAVTARRDEYDNTLVEYHGGMSLRTHIAIEAMKSTLMTSSFTLTHEQIAEEAYRIADAMLKKEGIKPC